MVTGAEVGPWLPHRGVHRVASLLKNGGVTDREDGRADGGVLSPVEAPEEGRLEPSAPPRASSVSLERADLEPGPGPAGAALTPNPHADPRPRARREGRRLRET